MQIYLLDKYVVIENTTKNCLTYIDIQQMQPEERIIYHEIPGKSWESFGAHMFFLYNKHYLCIVDYHSKFLIHIRLSPDYSNKAYIVQLSVDKLTLAPY